MSTSEVVAGADDDDSGGSNDGLSVGAIAGIAAGALVALVLLTVLCVWCRRRSTAAEKVGGDFESQGRSALKNPLI